MHTHDEFDTLAVFWALDALDADARAAFAAHLQTCPRCARSVADNQEMLSVLATALIPAARTPRADRLASAIDERAPVWSIRQRRGHPSWRQPAAWAAAASLVIGLGGWNIALHEDRNASRADASRYRDATRTLLTAHGTRITLDTASGSRVATVVVTGTAVRVVAEALPPNDRARSTYVLWGIAGAHSAPVAIGTFDVKTADVSVSTLDPISGGSREFAGYGLSREPARTTPTVPSSILADGTPS